MGAPRPTPHAPQTGKRDCTKSVMANCNHPACHPIYALRPLYNLLFEVQGKSEGKLNLYQLVFFIIILRGQTCLKENALPCPNLQMACSYLLLLL